jgi:ribonuclease Z
MTKSIVIGFVAGALLLIATPLAHAAPCLIVTITGAGAGPQVFQGQAGPGTLIRYGDDGDNCNAVKRESKPLR